MEVWSLVVVVVGMVEGVVRPRRCRLVYLSTEQ